MGKLGIKSKCVLIVVNWQGQSQCPVNFDEQENLLSPPSYIKSDLATHTRTQTQTLYRQTDTHTHTSQIQTEPTISRGSSKMLSGIVKCHIQYLIIMCPNRDSM